MLKEIVNDSAVKEKFERFVKAQGENLQKYIAGNGTTFPVEVCGLTYNDGSGGAIAGLKGIEAHKSETQSILNVDGDSFYPTILRNMYDDDKSKFEGIIVEGIKEDGSSGNMEDFCAVLKNRLEAKQNGNKDLSATLKNRLNVFTGKLREHTKDVSDRELSIALEMCMRGRRIIVELAFACEAMGFVVYHMTTDALMFSFNPQEHDDKTVANMLMDWIKSNNITVTCEKITDLWQCNVNKYYTINDKGGNIIVGYGNGRRTVDNITYCVPLDARTGLAKTDAEMTPVNKAREEIIAAVSKKSVAHVVETPSVIRKTSDRPESVSDGVTNGVRVSHNLDAVVGRVGELPTDGIWWDQTTNPMQNYRYVTITNKTTLKNNALAKANGKPMKKEWNRKPELMMTWSDAQDKDDIGLEIEAPLFMVDVDDPLIARVIYKYVTDNKVKCIIDKTTRGIHIFFRVPDDAGDISKLGYVKGEATVLGCLPHIEYIPTGNVATLKLCGDKRPIIYGSEFPISELDWLPLILRTVNDWVKPRGGRTKISNTGFDMLGLLDGYGREDVLHRYGTWCYCQAHVTDPRELRTIAEFIAHYLFGDTYGPDRDDVLEKFANPASYAKCESRKVESLYFESGKLNTLKVVADLLKNNFYLPTSDRTIPLVYQDGYYQNGDYEILLQIDELVPEATESQRREVIKKLHIAALRKTKQILGSAKCAHEIKEDEYVVNVKNGRLNIVTGEFTEHTPLKLDRQRVPVTYDPHVTSDKYVDLMMHNITCGDKVLETMLWEALGCCLSRRTRRQKMYFFLGEGKNGKSTIIKMFSAVIGEDNIAHQSPADLEGSNFSSSQLEGKLANVCGELDGKDIESTKKLKQATGGDTITVERKFENQHSIIPYATFVFATNKMPNFADKSLGMLDRRLIIPFNAEFSTSDKDYIADLDELVTTENAKSYALNKATEAYKVLVERNFDYTVAEDSRKAETNYQADTNAVISWILGNNLGTSYFKDRNVDIVYGDFVQYKTEILHKRAEISQRTVTANIISYFGKNVIQRRRVPKPDRHGKRPYRFEVVEGVNLDCERNPVRESSRKVPPFDMSFVRGYVEEKNTGTMSNSDSLMAARELEHLFLECDVTSDVLTTMVSLTYDKGVIEPCIDSMFKSRGATKEEALEVINFVSAYIKNNDTWHTMLKK